MGKRFSSLPSRNARVALSNCTLSVRPAASLLSPSPAARSMGRGRGGGGGSSGRMTRESLLSSFKRSFHASSDNATAANYAPPSYATPTSAPAPQHIPQPQHKHSQPQDQTVQRTAEPSSTPSPLAAAPSLGSWGAGAGAGGGYTPGGVRTPEEIRATFAAAAARLAPPTGSGDAGPAASPGELYVPQAIALGQAKHGGGGSIGVSLGRGRGGGGGGDLDDDDGGMGRGAGRGRAPARGVPFARDGRECAEGSSTMLTCSFVFPPFLSPRLSAFT